MDPGSDSILNHEPIQGDPSNRTSLLINWLLVMFALTLERLFRLRYLHRGTHRPPTAIDLVRRFRLSLATPIGPDSS